MAKNRTIPFGYCMRNGKIITESTESKAVVRIFEEYLNGSSLMQIAKLMELADGCVDLYSGNDNQIVPILSLGGKGVISVTSNVAPKQTHDICQLYFDGNVEKSCKEQLRMIDLCDALFCEVNPIPVKKALNLMGMNAGVLRRPLTEMEPQNAARLEKAMKDYGIL